MERDIVFEGKDEQGNPTIDLPITRLGNIEDSADIKQTPEAGDYVPIMDASDNGQMKKTPASALGGATAPVYSSVKTYNKGDYCSNGGKFYRCIVDIPTPEEWTPAHWEETTVVAELKTTRNTALSAEAMAQAAKDAATGGAGMEYSSGKTYNEGDYCNKDGQLYVCTTKIPVGEPWNPGHWAATSLTDELKEVKSSVEEIIEGGGGTGGGNVIKITFGQEFVGHEYEVTDGAGEVKTGTVPASRVANVSVTGCNTTYSIKSTAEGVEYTTEITTGPYYGQYSIALNVFTATINVTTAPGAAVTASGAGMSYTATANSSGIAAVNVRKSGTYAITATRNGRSSTEASVGATTDGGTYSAAVNIIIPKVPSQAGSIVYDGTEKRPEWNDLDDTELTLGGTVKATNAGTSQASITPKPGCQWNDGSTTAKTVNWTIDPADGSLSIDKSTLALTGTSPNGVIGVTRAGDGQVEATSSNPAVATVSVDGTNVNVAGLGDGSTVISVTVRTGTNHKAVTVPVTCTVTASNMVKIYGVCWNYADGSSSTALTRLTPDNDPNHMVNATINGEPSPAIGNGSGSSPCDTLKPWCEMEEYNVENGVIGAKQGEGGFSRTSKDTVVKVPEFGFKVIDDAVNKKRYYYLADKPNVGGCDKHPGSGKYVGRYHFISGYYSKAGAKPLVNIDRPTARNGAKGKGAKYRLYDIATWSAVNLLYLIEFADWNCQAKIGQGWNGSQSATINTGATDSMTYHTGTAGSSRTTAAEVQYRHIEGLWSNVRDWLDGANFNDRKAYVCTDPSKYADGTATNYIDTGITLPSSGWIKSLGMSATAPWAFIPSENGGSETTRIPDYVSSSTGWMALNVGGTYNSTAGNCGLWYFYAYSAASTTSGNLGGRLLVDP